MHHETFYAIWVNGVLTSFVATLAAAFDVNGFAPPHRHREHDGYWRFVQCTAATAWQTRLCEIQRYGPPTGERLPVALDLGLRVVSIGPRRIGPRREWEASED